MDILNFSHTEIHLQSYECAETLKVSHFCIVLLLQTIYYVIMLQWSIRNMPIYRVIFFPRLDKRLPETARVTSYTECQEV